MTRKPGPGAVRTARFGVLAALGFLLLRCVSEQEILSASPVTPGIGGNDAGGGNAVSSGGTSEGDTGGDGGVDLVEALWNDCDQALARGLSGDSCAGTFTCTTPPRGCCQWSASCIDGLLAIIPECSGCACQADEDCEPGAWCSHGSCAPCPDFAGCPFGSFPATRNGCAWCVPITDCAGDGDCEPGLICYAGVACSPDCADDPSCCFGNVCAAPGCGSTQELDCSLVGCPDGRVCEVADPGQVCACLDGRWLCSTDSRNTCVGP